MFAIKHQIPSLRKKLKNLTKSQVPFATALALNDTAQDLAEAEKRALLSSLDAPTPFTQKAFYTLRANKKTQRARVGIKRIQSGYLKFAVDGGTRTPKGRAILVPAGIKLNRYGNMPRGAIKRVASRADSFVVKRGAKAARNLRPGVYRRPKKKKRAQAQAPRPELLVSFADQARYTARFPFLDVARDTFRRVYRAHYQRRLSEAILKAR